MERYDEMIKMCDNFLSKNENNIGMIVWKGIAFKHLNRIKECEQCFGIAADKQPMNDMFVTLYCSILMEKKDWNKLMEFSKKMIDFKPTAASYHNNYIQALENLNETEKAEEHVSIILEKYGQTSPSINFVIGDYYYKHERFEDAELCLQRAAELDIKNEKYQQYYIRSLLQNGKQSEADKYCHQLINKDPNNARWINTVGYICFDAFDFESAAKHFKRCIELDPNDPYNVVDYAMVLCELNCLDEAEKVIREILQKAPNFVSASYRLARIYEYRKEYAKSQQIYLDIIKVNPNKAKMNMAYGHLLHLMEEYEESKKYFEIAKNIDKANPWYHYWYGLLLISDYYKKYDAAIKCFDQCLKLQATHHKCRYEYACLLYNVMKRDKKKAIEMMKEAVKTDYKNEEYKRVLKEFEDGYDGEDDEKKQDDNDNVAKLVKREYVFKSIDNANKTVVCMDNDFNDVALRLDQLKLDEIENIKRKIDEGAKEKKDVKIVVVETHTKNNKISQKVSHAVI